MIKIKLEDSQVAINDNCKTKKSILEKISELLSKPSGVSSNEIFTRLYDREKLGSTSVGKGVAIPHARIQNIDYPFLSIMILDEPVDFDNIDSLDVDIIASIIVPDENFSSHLELLAYLSSKLDDPLVRKELRQARNGSQIIKSLRSENLEFI
tara:strand:- start:6336 stop:6794 length:459 start_codon:yes stop_codon:yes gene_type:complete